MSVAEPTSDATTVDDRPEAGDLVIDAALSDLDATPDGDLDGFIASGEAVHQTLKSRLTDLGG